MEAVRPAEPADAERCSALCVQALRGLQEVRGGSLFARRETGLVAKALVRPGGLDRLLGERRRKVLVGTVEGAIVGLAVGRVDEVGEVPLGVVDGLYVQPEGRGVGVGRAMLDELMAWFSASGCRGADATALPGDRLTKNLFEAAGFKGRLVTMYRALD